MEKINTGIDSFAGIQNKREINTCILFHHESCYSWKHLKTQMLKIMTLNKCIFYGLFIYTSVNLFVTGLPSSEIYYVPGRNTKAIEMRSLFPEPFDYMYLK